MRGLIKRAAQHARVLAGSPRVLIGGFRPELSLVVPTYNVAAYMDQFLESIANQTVKPRGLEIIIVDDGSTDGVRQVLERWQEQLSGQIRYTYQDNAGLASARNTGLEMARGRWVGFPDPDDFLDRNYFKHMLRAARESRKALLVVSNVGFFHESDGAERPHPLSYRFRNGSKTYVIPELGSSVYNSVAYSWIDRRRLRRSGLTFDGAVRPTFEDGFLLNQLLLQSSGRRVLLVPDAWYHYRKRSSQESLVDQSRTTRHWFIDQVKLGYLRLLNLAAQDAPAIPTFIQRIVLYEMMFRLRWVVDRPERLSHLSGAEQQEFEELTSEIMALLDTDIIENFSLARCTERYRVGILWRYKEARRARPWVYVEESSPHDGLLKFTYFHGYGDQPNVQVSINGKPTAPTIVACTVSEFMSEPLWCSHTLWIPVGDEEIVEFHAEDAPCLIRRDSLSLGVSQAGEQLRSVLAERPGVSGPPSPPSAA